MSDTIPEPAWAPLAGQIADLRGLLEAVLEGQRTKLQSTVIPHGNPEVPNVGSSNVLAWNMADITWLFMLCKLIYLLLIQCIRNTP